MNPESEKMVGVILAAGRGARIEPLSFDLPKPMLPICNKPLMQYQIESMMALGIRDFVIVVGHLREKIEECFGDGSALGVRIRYVEQTTRLGIAHAVGLLENHIDRPFFLFLGDIFIVPKKLGEMVRVFHETKAEAVLAVKPETDPEIIQKNFTVSLIAGTHRVKRVIEKPRWLTTNLKGCGIYLMNLSIFDAIRNTPRTAMRDEYEITTAIQILIDGDYPVFIADVVDWDMNVTIPDDLLRCNLQWLDQSKQECVIHPSARLAPGTRVCRSVIGADVQVLQPVTIRDSLLLDGCTIDSAEEISEQVVTPVCRVGCHLD